MQDSEGNEIRTIRPFSTGTQYMDWEASNCGRCIKASTKEEFERGEFACSIEMELAYGTVGDGTISDDAATRMRYVENKGKYVWQCGEWEPTEEWKTIVTAKNNA